MLRAAAVADGFSFVLKMYCKFARVHSPEPLNYYKPSLPRKRCPDAVVQLVDIKITRSIERKFHEIKGSFSSKAIHQFIRYFSPSQNLPLRLLHCLNFLLLYLIAIRLEPNNLHPWISRNPCQ